MMMRHSIHAKISVELMLFLFIVCVQIYIHSHIYIYTIEEMILLFQLTIHFQHITCILIREEMKVQESHINLLMSYAVSNEHKNS